MKFKDFKEAQKYVDEMLPYGECLERDFVKELAEFFDTPLKTDKYDENDLYVTANMIENEYGDIGNLDEDDKFQMALKFLDDINAPPGKIKRYLDNVYAKENKEKNNDDKV